MSDCLTVAATAASQNSKTRTLIAIAWCLAWSDKRNLQDSQALLNQIRGAIATNGEPSQQVKEYVRQAKALQSLAENDFSESLEKLSTYPEVWQLWQQKTRIGLVYGGATKIKQYVFEEAKLQDVRGASALLDRINLIDLPAFFHAETSDRFPQCQKVPNYCQQVREWLNRDEWLNQNSELSDALIPELIVYSTGGNILAFCPAAFVDELADAIEKRYTFETLTANSCAVGDRFSPLEIFLGILPKNLDKNGEIPFWFGQFKQDWQNNSAIRAYFDLSEPEELLKLSEAELEKELRQKFRSRKDFSELVSKLANQFNQRRSGYDDSGRPTRRYPPMFETHPYLVRDDGDRRSAVVQVDANDLPSTPKLSEPVARKRRVGQLTKREESERQQWYPKAELEQVWNPTTEEFNSWVNKFERYLCNEQLVRHYDPKLRLFDENQQVREIHKREARSLREIGDASNGFVAYIYADGNNMGQYIRDEIKTPEQYQQFSEDIFEATEQSVYYALSRYIQPHFYVPDSRSERKSSAWIHPFEIVTIGGDDVLLIVPADKALAIARTIGEEFEKKLVATGRYPIQTTLQRSPLPMSGEVQIHRYKPNNAPQSQCCLSISSGVLITAENTPIYYADKLVSQLLKSAKKRAKELREKGYYSGTVDFLTMKAVTMISSDINSFRDEGLTVRFPQHNQNLKLYAAPYTLHELEGLIETVKAVKKSEFPRSQLYQIRSLLERGKRTSILNYRYFRVRLKEENQILLKQHFEKAWCEPLESTNLGNLAPWMTVQRKDDPESDKTIYETLWRELVELLDFIIEDDGLDQDTRDAVSSQVTATQEGQS